MHNVSAGPWSSGHSALASKAWSVRVAAAIGEDPGGGWPSPCRSAFDSLWPARNTRCSTAACDARNSSANLAAFSAGTIRSCAPDMMSTVGPRGSRSFSSPPVPCRRCRSPPCARLEAHQPRRPTSRKDFDRRQRCLDLTPVRLEEARQLQRGAKCVDGLVDGKAWDVGGDLEQDATGLAEVD